MATIDKWDNRIRANIKTAVSPKCTNVVNYESDLNAVFPCVWIHRISGRDTAVDLDNSDTGVTVGYQITVYTSGSTRKSMANSIFDLAYDSMKKMGFVMENYVELEGSSGADKNSASVYQLYARFRRYIGSGEEIAKQ